MSFIERRKADEHDTYLSGCALCHGLHGFLDRLVVVGTGLRALHPDCRERMQAMGYDIIPERRK